MKNNDFDLKFKWFIFGWTAGIAAFVLIQLLQTYF